MHKGNIYMYYGNGRGKTTLAIGQGMRAVGEGHSVVMVQFLDCSRNKEHISLKRLEPHFRLFKFEKERENIQLADKEELRDELHLALNFCRKIMETGESEVLILDGISDAVESGFIAAEEVIELLRHNDEEMDVIITGNAKNEEIEKIADFVYSINIEKFSNKES